MSSKEIQSKLDNFTGIFWAFNAKQFNEGMEKIKAEDNKSIYTIGAGGYILKSRFAEYKALLKELKKELKRERLESKRA